MIKILTVLLLCAILAAPIATARAEIQGNTYHVATTGSDTSGDGTSGRPWKTIQHGVDQLAAGDTLLILAGTYTEEGIILDSRSGTAAQPITIRANSAGVVIQGSGTRGTQRQDSLLITYADYVVVDGITFQNSNRAGMRIDNSNHVSVRNSTFANNQTWGIFTDFSDYTLIENSESYGAKEQHGIYISNSSDYPTIRHNRIHDNVGCGLHMNGDINSQPDDGTIADGIISNGLVEGNIIYNNGYPNGGSAINMDGVTDSIVRNNLLYNNHASGISIFQIDGGSGSKRDKILNNTILMASNGRWDINIPEPDTSLPAYGNTGNQVFNNILYNYHSWHGVITIGPSNLSGFTSDYNAVMDRLSDDGDDTVISLAAWQALGYDQHSFIAAPAQLFLNAGGSDYHLSASSLGIDKGKALADVSDDLEGRARPAGAGFDVGAYEFTPSLVLTAASSSQTISLSWTVNASLPQGATWRIDYSGPAGNPASPIQNLAASARSFLLTSLTNNSDYAITLSAMQGATVLMTSTIHVTPRAHNLFLPLLKN